MTSWRSTGEPSKWSLDASRNELNYLAQAKWNHFTFQLGTLCGIDRASRLTKSITTDSLPMRYTVITLNGGSVDVQDGRLYAQADVSWSPDVGGQDARRSSQGGCAAAPKFYTL